MVTKEDSILASPHLASSFLKILLETVEKNGDKTFAFWYNREGKPTLSYSFDQVWVEAGYVAHYLRINRGLKKGDRIILSYSSCGIESFIAFLGCLRAGIIAVLLISSSPPAADSDDLSNDVTGTAYSEELTKVVEACDAKLIIEDSLGRIGQERKNDEVKLQDGRIIPFHVHPKPPKNWSTSRGNEELSFSDDDDASKDETYNFDSLAFIQYSFGSNTGGERGNGDPKEMMVSFGALHANVKCFIDWTLHKYNSVGVVKSNERNIKTFSYLPQCYDDNGLGKIIFISRTNNNNNMHWRTLPFILFSPCYPQLLSLTKYQFFVALGFVTTLASFVSGWDCHMMSPVDFISDPLLWVKLMSRLQVNISFAPNFAYGLVAKEIVKAKQNNPSFGSDLDLSSIVYLLDAAEPIEKRSNSMTTIHRDPRQDPVVAFASRTSYPVADNHVAFASCLHEFQFLNLPQNRSYVAVVGNRNDNVFSKSQTMKIVSLDEIDRMDGNKVWISGPSVISAGRGMYFDKKLESNLTSSPSEQVSRATLLLVHQEDDEEEAVGIYKDHDNNLYINGRLTDLVTMNGVNYFPQDIEAIVEEAVPGAVKPGCVAAFTKDDENGYDERTGNEEEELEIIFEVNKSSVKDCTKIAEIIRIAIVQNMGLSVSRIVAVEEESLLKTTSGKIQRWANRKALHDGNMKILYNFKAQTPMAEWQKILGDSPTKLEVDDFSNDIKSVPKHYINDMELDTATVDLLQCFCEEKGVSLLSVAMKVLHRSLRSYSHEPFALGVVNDTGGLTSRNTVLVPFKGGDLGDLETVQDLHMRWKTEILPNAETPFEMILKMGYQCNIFFELCWEEDEESNYVLSEESYPDSFSNNEMKNKVNKVVSEKFMK